MSLLLMGAGNGVDSAPAGDVAFTGTATTDVKSDSDSTHSFSHTRPVTTQGALMVKTMNRTPATSVTYNGVNLTKIREEGFASNGCSIWMGNNADMATGSNTVTITFGGSTSEAVARVENLENVDQATMSDADSGSNGTASSSSNSVTITAGGMALDAISIDFWAPTKSEGANQTVLNATADGVLETASSHHVTQTAGSRTLGWTWSLSDDYGHVIVAVKNG